MTAISGIEWFGPHFSGLEKKYLQQVLDSGYINDGPMSRKLEKSIADITKTKYAIAVTSGTAAIH